MHLDRVRRVRTRLPGNTLRQSCREGTAPRRPSSYLLLYCICCAEPVSQRDLRIVFKVSSLLCDLCYVQHSEAMAVAGRARESHGGAAW